MAASELAVYTRMTTTSVAYGYQLFLMYLRGITRQV